jgi:hypothetical protein
MSRDRKLDAREMALKKFREASLWWESFDRSVNEWRARAVYYLAMKRVLDCALARKSPLARSYREEFDRAHDMLLATKENVISMARTASACEMGGRIYQEEFEEREWSEGKRDGNHRY